ncbi:MAG: tetratricopeptide repeat protein [Candidatus Hydrogenedentes bacterium]|nr:tetratricopeptide repeat protein [Candidatus Hydrogenedentota bacterium]
MSPKKPSLDTVLDLVDSGDYGEALAALNELDQDKLDDEGRARILGLYVLCFRGVGEDDAADQALAEAEAALSQDPDFALATGEQLLDLDEYEDAQWIFERYCLAYPKEGIGWYNLAFTRESLDRFEEALSAYNTALELDADFPDSYRGKASCLDALGRMPEAMEAYQRYLALNPTDADAWIGLANICTELKDFDGAYSAFSTAEQLEAEPLRLYMMWAICALGRQDLPRLEQCLARMQEFAPEEWRTIAVDAMLAEVRGERERGWERYRHAFDLANESLPPEAIYVAAELMLGYAVRNELKAEYEDVLPRLFESRPFNETVLGAMRILSGKHSEKADDFMVVIEGSLKEEDIEDVPEEENDYGPPYRFLRMVRVLATSEDEAVRMVMEFETRCNASRMIVHEVQRTKWKGGGHLGVWMRPPAEVFSENAPDGPHDN